MSKISHAGRQCLLAIQSAETPQSRRGEELHLSEFVQIVQKEEKQTEGHRLAQLLQLFEI